MPELHPTQRQVVQHAKRYNVLACGRRWGKDTLLDTLMIPALLGGKHIAVLLPKDTDRDRVIERLRVNYLLPLLENKLLRYDQHLHAFKQADAPGEIRFYTVRNYGSIRGSSLDMFVANEAGELSTMLDLDREVWQEVVRPALLDRKGQAWFAGTPRGVNSFYALYVRGVEGVKGWASWNYSTYDNPLIDRDEIEAMIQQERMSRLAIDQEIYARFVQAEGTIFSELDAVCVLKPTEPNQYPKYATCVGIDIGGARDYTVVSVMARRQPAHELQLYRWRDVQVRRTLERIVDICKAWLPIEVMVEANSIGEYFYQELAYHLASHRVAVARYVATNETKADIIHALRHALENRMLFLLDDEQGRAELAAFSLSYTSTGKPRFSAISGTHDDTVVARALAYASVRRYIAAHPTVPIIMTAVKLDGKTRTGKDRSTYSVAGETDLLATPKFDLRNWR